MKNTIEKNRRQYNQWVANETLEDYALRYSPSEFRKWSPFLLANTALGGISFLALEAIGATLLINYGFSNAVWAIILASIIIFFAGLPISYYAARYNIDIDLLTRSAGFGYVGSTITSLIYASFCFIFFALEAAIMAQALKLYFNISLPWGYLLCSVIIIPIVYYGVTAINQLHKWTQPLWLILMLLPFYFVFTYEPHTLDFLFQFEGLETNSNHFDWYYFGIATGISFSLIPQIGEQVDYLRFLPDKNKNNRYSWWFSLLTAGPGWIILGCAKQLAGAFLASLVVLTGLAIEDAKEPVQMYLAAYNYVFENPKIALLVSTIFVLISQIKINVTNAYAGSLAWSNFFSRVTHLHPGRVVWLIFNIAIALLLMELGVFEGINKVLGLYSNVAIAWIFSVFADLAINKPLKLSPPLIEFKRAHLYNYNPVGFVSMQVASLFSILAFIGLFGDIAQAYSWLIAMLVSLTLSPLIAYLTKGKYYIARENTHFSSSDTAIACGICEQTYAENDMAHCPIHTTPICSLCCTLESNCQDKCKPQQQSFYHQGLSKALSSIFKHYISTNIVHRISSFILVSGGILCLLGVVFWLVYSSFSQDQNSELFLQSQYILFSIISILVCMSSWWIVLNNESRFMADKELNSQNEHLIKGIKERKQIETALRESENTFRHLFEDSSDPICLLQKGQFIDCNTAAYTQLGYKSKTDLIQRTPADISPELQEDGQSSAEKAIEKLALLKQQNICRFNWLHKKVDGTIFPTEVSLSTIKIKGKIIIYVTWRDTSERNAYEEQLRLSKDQAELANRVKSEFLANMSHELRTPMHGILSFSKLGIKRLKTAQKEKLEQYFQRISESGNRLLNLLNDLLDLSKLESGQMVFKYNITDLKKLAESCVSEQQARLMEMKLAVTINSKESSQVSCDSLRIGQVITNLLSNAIKFSPEQGHIKIKIKSASFTLLDGQIVNGLQLSVTDNGIGIPADELETVFDKFIQSSKTKTNAGGTGLGLSICTEIIKGHQGKIWVNNNDNAGATFHFMIPQKKP